MRARAFSALAMLLLAISTAAAGQGEHWQYYLAGDARNVETQTRGLVVLQGGGDWVDENYTAMAAHAGYGDFVVLRASGAEEYSEYIHAICDCNSVETIVFADRSAAFDEQVLQIIRNAEALFIAGGDQDRYVRFWKATPVADAINALAARPAPIGGTSAGMAVLGEFVYSAMAVESLTTVAALADPFDKNLTLEKDFLQIPMLSNVLTDQHLEERDRMGRTVTMLARLDGMRWTTDPRAIAADRETALHIDPETGVGQVFATSSHKTPYIYFLRLEPGHAPRPGVALTTGEVKVDRLGPGDRFDLRRWQSAESVQYTLQGVDGVLVSSSDTVYGPAGDNIKQ